MKTVEAMQLIQLLERFEALGADGRVLRDAARLDDTLLADPDTRLPWNAALQLIAEAERHSGDPLIALRAGLMRPRGLLIHQFRAQESLKDALALFSRNTRLAADPFALEVREGTREVSLCIGVDDTESDAVCAVREYITGCVIRFVLEVFPSVRPRQVRFPHAPRGSLAEYERLVRAPVLFRRAECAIGIAPDLLSAALPTANPIVARMIDDVIERRLAVRRAGEFRASVERTMEQLLRERRALAREPVARQLRMSVRTLQRRLEGEGFTFRAVREAVVHRVATALLARPSLSLEEVAQHVGFADEDAFAKAWKRWTGKTPHEQRRAS